MNRVTVSAEQVRFFNSTWPCSPIPVETITFEYATNGDLVDIISETPSEFFDGDALLALSYDAAKGYGTFAPDGYDRFLGGHHGKGKQTRDCERSV